MPFDRNNLIFVLQCLYNFNLIKINRVTDMQLIIVAGTCQKVAINTIAYTPNLLGMELLVSKALSHI